MTPGHQIRAPLPPPPAQDESRLANPATAIALANQPTPAPDRAACPSINPYAALPADAPPNPRALVTTIETYLNDGGTLVALEDALRGWRALGAVRGDLDVSGEGVPEVVISLNTADGGQILAFACADARYTLVYQAAPGGDAPRLIDAGDINADGAPDLAYSARVCEAVAADDACAYRAGLAAWRAPLGRLIDLLDGLIESDEPPTLEDIDSDRVQELIVRFGNPGNRATGPLRTGFTVYDWDGERYRQSITQLDPPRFTIQAVFGADAAFAGGRTNDARALYGAVIAGGLEPWLGGDEAETLASYARYRLLLLEAFTEGDPLTAFNAIGTAYPDLATAPVYVDLARVFWEEYQRTDNLNSACTAVRAIIPGRSTALELLNRYGSQSPVVDAAGVCPF